jgi:hypothetical protein
LTLFGVIELITEHALIIGLPLEILVRRNANSAQKGRAIASFKDIIEEEWQNMDHAGSEAAGMIHVCHIFPLLCLDTIALGRSPVQPRAGRAEDRPPV